MKCVAIALPHSHMPAMAASPEYPLTSSFPATITVEGIKQMAAGVALDGVHRHRRNQRRHHEAAMSAIIGKATWQMSHV